ncbi:MAG: PDZ domain-containing protein, partial [Planctomycetes bacterium]|nr:PDZ domain-containing protein [Planctomycetota bacterium]
DPQLVGSRVLILGGRLVLPVQVIIGSHWKGGLEGLKYLHQIPRAAILSLHSAPLGDEVIPVLLDLPQVKRIELYGTNLSDEAIKELREKLSPDVALDVRSAARLGMQGPHRGPAQVLKVIADSAAEKAGLQPGDLITELDGEKVDDFTALTDRIATHEPGDTVTLKVTRKKKQLDIQVTFDRWGTDLTKPPTFTQPAAQPIREVVPKKINFGRR